MPTDLLTPPDTFGRAALWPAPETPDGVWFAHNGKDYFLPRQTKEDQEKFHGLANALAVSELSAMRGAVGLGLMTQEDFVSMFDVTATQISTGWFEFGSPGGYERRLTTSGMAALCWLAMRRHDPAVTWAEVKQMVNEAPALVQEQYVRANKPPKPAADSTNVKGA